MVKDRFGVPRPGVDGEIVILYTSQSKMGESEHRSIEEALDHLAQGLPNMENAEIGRRGVRTVGINTGSKKVNVEDIDKLRTRLQQRTDIKIISEHVTIR